MTEWIATPNSWPARKSYAPGNKRVWRGNGTIDEITFWSPAGQKLGTYAVTATAQTYSGGTYDGPYFYATQTGTNYYFGSKLIKNASGWVYSDRLGSIGKFYPYGQERPSATTNGTEKFTGYFRDAETGNDYAINRYQQPGTGRFLTPDQVSGKPGNPGSENKYAYAGGDPVNNVDPSGRDFCLVDDPTDCVDDSECSPDVAFNPEGPLYRYCVWGVWVDPTAPQLIVGGVAAQTVGGGKGAYDMVHAIQLLTEAGQFLIATLTNSISTDCNNDLTAVGVTPSQIIDQVGQANIISGSGNQTNYAQGSFGNTPAFNAYSNIYGALTVGGYFAANPGTVAVAQALGNNIYIDPTWINSTYFSTASLEALLVHEFIHNITGNVDSTIQGQLGIADNVPSDNINQWLTTDCFK